MGLSTIKKMSELLVRADDTPTPSPEKQDPFSVPSKPKPEENPIVTPGTPFLPPTRKPTTEPPQKPIPFFPGPMRTLPFPAKRNPDSPEVQPNSPHKGPVRPSPQRRAA